jgi:hypothetical protein
MVACNSSRLMSLSGAIALSSSYEYHLAKALEKQPEHLWVS